MQALVRVSLLVALLVASYWCNVILLNTVRRVREARSEQLRVRKRFKVSESQPEYILKDYSWAGTDYPRVLPVNAGPLQTSFEESVHYTLSAPEAEDEWLWTAPLIGDNHVRLGPQMRMFGVPMFHELHCLRNIHPLMSSGLASLSPARQAHIHHCFNYIRQWTLCDADVSLEPGDFEERNFAEERIGATRMCLDWEAVYEAVESNWEEWDSFQNAHINTTQRLAFTV